MKGLSFYKFVCLCGNIFISDLGLEECKFQFEYLKWHENSLSIRIEREAFRITVGSIGSDGNEFKKHRSKTQTLSISRS